MTSRLLVAIYFALMVAIIPSTAQQVAVLTSGSIDTTLSNVFLGNTPVADSGVAAREQYLQNRMTSVYSKLAAMDSFAAMNALKSASLYVMDNGGTNNTNATHRLGAPALLQLAIYQPDQSHHLPAAISQVQLDVIIRTANFRRWVAAGNDGNGDIDQRAERGAIAYECWLLNQVGHYFVASPGKAPVGSVQQVMEQFNDDFLEGYAASSVWTTTGYNKEIAQMLHPAYVLGTYQPTLFAQLYPKTAAGYTKFWQSTMAGVQATYQPDNTPEYSNLNLYMMFMMGIATGRLSRIEITDSAAYMTDSLDMPRLCDNLVREIMPSGDAVNYNKAASNWQPAPRGAYYAFSDPDNMAPFNLKMCYTLFGDDTYLWAARRLDRMQLTTNIIPAGVPIPTETFPANIQHWERHGVQPIDAVSTSSVSMFRTSTAQQCPIYNGTDLCRGVPQNRSVLVPNNLVLRTGISDDSAFAMVGLAVFGQHANQDQRLCLDNTLYRSAYTVSRAGRPQQQNQCNGPVAIQASTTADFPVIQTNSTIPSLLGASYNLSYTNVTQLPGNIGYADIVYSNFMLANVSVRRQTLLLPNGIIAVRDTFTTNASLAFPVKVGTNWRLWPGITSHGTNWALQAARSALNSTDILSAAPSSNTSTMFWVSTNANRTFGYTSEPLSTWIANTSRSQLVWNMHAYDVLGPGQSAQFLTLITPIQPDTNTSQLAVTITCNASAITVLYYVNQTLTNNLTINFASLA